ncbi:MAG: 23S rRNA (adenine(2503)-C(2))-methyltransferase RlmN [Clostridiales bacterium]|nr:23S rRNA (adenine(2503)-C(2))-methyltransferase RlmN [Clostridiales bacterium]
MKQALSDFSLSELEEIVAAAGEKKYRAGQLMRHIVAYDSFDEYTDLPKSFIAYLKERYIDRPLTEKTRVTASDGAVRYLFETASGDLIESVFLPHGYGNSVCVSCQVGCAMGCVFCASGEFGLKRNLTAGEILAQVLFIAREVKDKGGVKKIVMMGSGSPLHNYEQTVKFVKLVTSPQGINIGMRSISVSTCGLPDKIDMLYKDGFSGTLSLSLHAATDTKRIKIMKIAERYTVKQLVDALKRFFDNTGRRVVIEYILIGGFNDTEEDAVALKNLLKGLCCHVNLIPLNPTDNCDLKPSSRKNADAFCKTLCRLGLSATVRRSMGSDVAGACGQLKNRTVMLEKKEGGVRP